MTFFCQTVDTCNHGIPLAQCNLCQLRIYQEHRARDYGFSGLSRTGKLIWLHAAKVEGFDVRSRNHLGLVLQGKTVAGEAE